MRRALGILAAALAGLTLALLLLQAVRGGRFESVATSSGRFSLEDLEPPPLDPAVTMAEIAQLRGAKGTVLEGTSLGLSEQPDDFNIALATHTGTEPILSSHDNLVSMLRRAACEFDEQAERYETLNRYCEADDLRRLADEARRIARYVHADHAPDGKVPEANVDLQDEAAK